MTDNTEEDFNFSEPVIEVIEDENLLRGIEVVDRVVGFDASRYDSKKIKIEHVRKILATNFFPEGKFDPKSTEKMWKIEIETEKLKELDKDDKFTSKLVEIKKDDGTIKNITVRALFNLQEKTDENGKKYAVISKHVKATLWKFMRKTGCENVFDLKGKLIALTTVPSKTPGDDRKFLRIVV